MSTTAHTRGHGVEHQRFVHVGPKVQAGLRFNPLPILKHLMQGSHSLPQAVLSEDLSHLFPELPAIQLACQLSNVALRAYGAGLLRHIPRQALPVRRSLRFLKWLTKQISYYKNLTNQSTPADGRRLEICGDK